MRLVAGALALTLFASFAGAERTRSPASPGPARPSPGAAHNKVPLRVVRVMPESRQALLFDRTRSTHVLAEVGDQVDGYTVEDIDDDEVTLRFQGKQIVLAAPARASERRVDRRPDGRAPASARRVDAASTDAGPADAMTGEPTPVDPYGEPPIRVVKAPGGDSPDGATPAAEIREPGEGGVRVVRAPDVDGGPSAHTPATEIREPGEGGVRVVQAPSAQDPGIQGPDAQATSAQDPGGRVPSAPAPSVPAPTGQTAIPEASSAPTPTREAPTREAPTREAPARQAPRARASASENPAPAQTPYQANKQAIDARAMADVLTGGASDGAKPRAMVIGSPPRASEPEPRPATPSTPAASTATPISTPRASTAPTASTAPASSTSASSSAGAITPSLAVVLSRGEVQAALADFSRLTAAFHGSFSASGVVVDAVSDGTLFQRAGLRAGDVIASVDGLRLRSLDDAANLYARAATANAITAQIVRGGKPMTLHVAIR